MDEYYKGLRIRLVETSDTIEILPDDKMVVITGKYGEHDFACGFPVSERFLADAQWDFNEHCYQLFQETCRKKLEESPT